MTAGRKIKSDSQDWCTPPKYAKAVEEFFGIIHLDPCSNMASVVNAKTDYCLPKTDGLTASWDFPTIYVNPPYGTDRARGTSIKDWLRKCAEANQKHKSEVIALIPVAVNTRHWKEYVFGRANNVCFLADTRLKFLGGHDKGAPMACCIVYWGRKKKKFYDHFSNYGAVIDIENLKGEKWVSPDLKPKQKTLFENLTTSGIAR
jgi:hypothetical protein